LQKFVNRKWILKFSFMRQNSFCDGIGIDGIVWFKFDKGRHGDLSFQIKTRSSDVSLHSKKHPGIPAVILLRAGSSVKEVEEAFIAFFFAWSAFNEGERKIIFKKHTKCCNLRKQ